jgi:hypothetical protein
MTRTLKALGLALVTAFALSAAAATAASAESFAFHSEIQHTNLTGAGEGTSTFVGDAGTLECKTAKYEGTMTSQESTSLALSPLFESCTAALFSADVSMNGCQFVLTASTKEGGTYKAAMDISCSEGKSITMLTTLSGVTKCTIHIPAQTLSGVTVSEVSEGDVKAAASISGIKYSQTPGTGFGACAKAENTTNGTYSGVAIIAGSLGEAQVNVGMQAAAVVLSATSKVKFKGKDTEQIIKFTNETKNDLTKVLDYLVTKNGNDFLFTEDTCDPNGLAAGQTCQIKLRCIAASGKDAYQLTETQEPDPHGLTATKLEGC